MVMNIIVIHTQFLPQINANFIYGRMFITPSKISYFYVVVLKPCVVANLFSCENSIQNWGTIADNDDNNGNCHLLKTDKLSSSASSTHWMRTLWRKLNWKQKHEPCMLASRSPLRPAGNQSIVWGVSVYILGPWRVLIHRWELLISTNHFFLDHLTPSLNYHKLITLQ